MGSHGQRFLLAVGFSNKLPTTTANCAVIVATWAIVELMLTAHLLTAYLLNARYAAPKIPAWLPKLDFKISLGSLRQT